MNQILGELKQKGARLTKTRQLLIAVLEHDHLPMVEPEIRKFLAQRGRIVNKTTVYRELQVLTRFGFITQVDFGDGKIRYELAGRHHHHLVCTVCKKVQDINIQHDIARMEKIVKQEKKFKIIRHSLEFFGLCQKCNK